MTRIFVLLIAALLLNSCGSVQPANASSEETVNQVASSVITFKQIQLKLQILKNEAATFAVEGETITLNIDLEEGQYSGKSTCNSYFGKVELIGEDRLRFYAGGMTEMMCEEPIMLWEKRYLDALLDREFTVNEQKSNLLFASEESGIALTFIKSSNQEE